VRYVTNYAIRRQADYPAQRKWWTVTLIGLGMIVPSIITTPIAAYLAARTAIALTYPVVDKTGRLPGLNRIVGHEKPYRPLSNGSSEMKFRPTNRERNPETASRSVRRLQELGTDDNVIHAVSADSSPSLNTPVGRAAGSRSRTPAHSGPRTAPPPGRSAGRSPSRSGSRSRPQSRGHSR
jgi:hypothetical protein